MPFLILTLVDLTTQWCQTIPLTSWSLLLSNIQIQKKMCSLDGCLPILSMILLLDIIKRYYGDDDASGGKKCLFAKIELISSVR